MLNRSLKPKTVKVSLTSLILHKCPRMKTNLMKKSSTIRDKIIPHAVSWFTGEAVQEDEFDGLEEDDDDEEMDDDEDEDEDDDEEDDEDDDDDEDDEDEEENKAVSKKGWKHQFILQLLATTRLAQNGPFLSALSKSLSAYKNKLQSPTISSPFVLRTEERAARRKQKLEEKFNEKA